MAAAGAAAESFDPEEFGSWFLVPGFKYQVSEIGFGFRVSVFTVSGINNQKPGTRNQKP